MAPNLLPKDRAFSLKYNAAPRRGDVITFKVSRSVVYVKRIVGLPGDTIQVRKSRLILNGKPVQLKTTKKKFIGEYGSGPIYIETLPGGVSYYIVDTGPNSHYDNTPVYKVPPGHYFVLGDNRDNSNDSRNPDQIGFIAKAKIIGRITTTWRLSKGNKQLSHKVYISDGTNE